MTTNHTRSRNEPILVYLLAASHSGSTLTAMLLNAHPEICTAGELKATNLGDPQKYRCSCQTIIGNCEFWEQVATRMQSSGLDYSVCNSETSLSDIDNSYVQRLLKPLHRGRFLEFIRDTLLNLSATWREKMPVWRQRNRELIRSVSAVSGSRYVVDSSKRGVRLKYLMRDASIAVKVIRIVRDGRAVALTYMRPSHFADASKPALRGGGSGSKADPKMSMTTAAVEWRRSNEEAEEILANLPPGSAMQITYEDLCANPLATLNLISKFLGLGTQDSLNDFREANHHVIGNGMRLDQSAEVVLDERWRDVLDSQELLEFDRCAGEMNRRYGYS